MENSQGSSLKNDVYEGRRQEEIYILIGLIMEREKIDIKYIINKENQKYKYREQQKIYGEKRKEAFNRIK